MSIVNSTLIVKVHIPTNPKSRNPRVTSRIKEIIKFEKH